MKNMVSVIVPVYNGELYLKDCLQSILIQDYSNIEIVIVDDDSEDGSLAICNQYSAKHPNISVIHQKHSGPSVARNNGVKHCRGNYIMFIDCDDKLENKRLISDNIALFDNESDFIQYPIRKIFVDKCTNEILCAHTGSITTEEEYLKYLLPLYKPAMINGSVCNKIFRRKVFEQILFREGILHEDSTFMIDLSRYFYHVKFSNIGYYDYYIRSCGSINTSKRSFKWYSDYLNMQLLYYNASNNLQLSENVKLNNYITIIGTLRDANKSLNGDEFSELVKRVVKVSPTLREVIYFSKFNYLKGFKLLLFHIIGLKNYINILRYFQI